MKAIIISLNCVIDTHLYLDKFLWNKENFVIEKNVFAAGKGTNVAKTLNALSIPFELFILLGSDNQHLYNTLLEKEGIKAYQITCKGKTRENISIHAKNISETRFCEDTFMATSQSCVKLLDEAYKKAENNDLIVLSGKFPKGVLKEDIIDKLESFKNKNVKFILDSTSFTLQDYKRLKPYLIKPNEDEIKLYGETELDSIMNLRNNGVKNVAFSKGENGITFYRENEIISAIPCRVIPVSTSGAGDSSIAGFVYGIINKMDFEESVKFAVSCGTASCLTKGGFPPRYEDIKNIREKFDSLK